ncbi:MAG: response regulator transcription factor [Leclercia sp.]
MTIKMVIADEHTVIRRGMRAMMMDGPSLPLSVSGEAATTGELLTLLARETPDILLLGYALPESPSGMEGLPLLKWLTRHYPALKVLILSPDTNPRIIRLALEAGARAYLSRNTDDKTLGQALRAVMHGEVFVEHSLMNALFQGGKMSADTLSGRENDVLRLICKGLSLTDIACRMHLSIKTVSAHKMRAMEKLSVKNDCQLYCLLAKTRMFDIAI